MPRSNGSFGQFVRLAAVIAWLVIVTGCDAGTPVSIAQAQGRSEAPDCYVQADERTSLLQEQIEALCVGAPSATGPVDCFLAASRRLRLTDDGAILLCRCAADTGPYECFERMRRRTDLTEAQIEQLCSPTLSQGLLTNCRPIGG